MIRKYLISFLLIISGTGFSAEISEQERLYPTAGDNSREEIENLAPEIEALTKEFEKLFPEEAKEKKLYFPL